MKLNRLAVMAGAMTLVSTHAQAAAPAAPPLLEWNQVTDKDLGQTRTICGPVAAAMGPIDLARQPVAGLSKTLGSLVLGGEPTTDVVALSRDARRFKVVIQDYHAGFPADPANHFRGKQVCVAGPIALALVGGYEMLPTHPSQIAIRGEAVATIPRGHVRRLPAGAIPYDEAKKHVGQTRTVCGVVQSGWAGMVPARMFPPDFTVPANIRARLPADFALSTDQRVMTELYLGDRLNFTVQVPDALAEGRQPTLARYIGKDICVTGPLKPSLMEGAVTVVENLKAIRVLR